MSKKQAFNPYLPSWEYIPDGEPYVFGDRVYVYGSHDFWNGYVFCMGDYVCWSAPLNDLGNWRYEGVIYPRNADPMNKDGHMCLYAPDVTVGPDGRYYLYYVLDKVGVMSVAVCDEPAGRYEFYGYVHYKDGTRLGEREGDEPQFDPGVLTEDGITYMYSGFCGIGDKSRIGAKVVTLDKDMLTVIHEPTVVVPGSCYSEGTDFEKHAFFEASSIRKVGDKYYFIYSSEVMHELCYAVSDSPLDGFKYGGVLVSNTDLHIDSYKPADMPTCRGANNHGSIIQLNDDWYIFYHRHTNGTWFSRQGCAEKLTLNADGSFGQAEITSCGLNGGPLKAEGTYPAVIACNITNGKMPHGTNKRLEEHFPNVNHAEYNGEIQRFIDEISDGTLIGFKYFDFKGNNKLTLTVDSKAEGEITVRNEPEGEVLGTFAVSKTNGFERLTAEVGFKDGKQALYLTFKGSGELRLLDISF